MQIPLDKRVRRGGLYIVDKQNGGAGSARNAGLSCARGEYTFFMDSDDVLLEGALFALYDEAKKYNLDLLCFESDYMLEDITVTYTPFTFKQTYNGIYLGTDLYKARHKNGDYCVVPWRNILKTQMLKEHHFAFYEGIMDEDMISMPEFYFMAMRAKVLHKKLYVYRVRKDSVTNVQGNDTKKTFAFVSKLTVAVELERLKSRYSVDEGVCARLDVSIRNRQRKLLSPNFEF